MIKNNNFIDTLNKYVDEVLTCVNIVVNMNHLLTIRGSKMIVTNHAEIIEAQNYWIKIKDRAARPDEIFSFIKCMLEEGKPVNEIHNRLLRLVKLEELKKAARLTHLIDDETEQVKAITRVAFKILHRIMTDPAYKAA